MMTVNMYDRPAQLFCAIEGAKQPVPLPVTLPTAWRDSARFSPELARLCAGLSFSFDDRTLLTANLKALGFDRLSFHPAEGDEPSRTGAAFAMRRLDGGTLVAAVLGGTKGTQWYSNFRVGYSTEHRGFTIAADDVEARLERYLRAYIAGEARYLITGYSRGGATANLLARRISDRCGTGAVSCYTFAAPNTAVMRPGAVYRSIFNLVREEDFFTRLPLHAWGYGRYGSDRILGGDIRGAYRELTARDYIGCLDRGEIDGAVASIRELAPNVPAYYKRQRPLGEGALSLYDYMLAVATLLSGREEDEALGIIMDSLLSDYAGLTAFLAAGADLGALLTSGGIPRCSLADSHSPAAYLAAMRGLRRAPQPPNLCPASRTRAASTALS